MQANLLHEGNSAGVEVGASQKKKCSKRYGLARLPGDWREQIFSSIKAPRLKQAVAILSATGCRPCELERGVLVGLKEGHLRVGIHGAKVTPAQNRGQERRLLAVDTTTPWGSYLAELVAGSDVPLLMNYDAGGVSQRLREISQKLWPRRKDKVSAYTYRHYLGKALKESGEDPIKIASALGHASDYAQTVYGRAGGGRKAAGAHGILNAVASSPVRHSPKSDRINRLLRNLKNECSFNDGD